MDYDFLRSFTPRILDVVEREHRYWELFRYELMRERTRLNVLAYVRSGSGTLETAGQRVALSPGCLFQVQPDSFMRITTDEEDTLCFYSVHFRYGLARWEGTEMNWQDCSELLPFPRVWLLKSSPMIEEEFRSVCTLWNDKNNGYEWHVKSGFNHILQQLSLLGEREQDGEPSTAAAMQSIIDYMKSHYSANLSREQLAKHASLSPTYFSISFKKYTGLSPVHYLNKIRLDRAKQLLKNTRLPIKEVAGGVGFEDSFYFTRLFSRETGMTPSQYRNS